MSTKTTSHTATVRCHPDTKHRLRVYAAMHDLTMSEIVDALICRFLAGEIPLPTPTRKAP